ncbi:MAG: phosphotransacetylase family protein [Parachlamydiaceae bacterium]
MRKKAVFIAATGQNVGKTTLCLGIVAGLKKRFPSVGFIKPVGQQHVKVDDSTNVDKDAILFKKHFSLEISWQDMSPVIIPNGYTRDYLDGAFTESSMLEKIPTSFQTIASKNHYTIVEGTGHVGVGSIINLNNAAVASKLGLDMILIASGGLGSAHDELALNISLCHQQKVHVRGVILNRVLDDKRDMILDYFPKSLKKWGIPLVGCVPYNELLSQPTIQDFANLFNAKLFSGSQYRYRHFKHMRLVADSVEAYSSTQTHNELIITPASREEIILANIEKHRFSQHISEDGFAGGMILTGYSPPSEAIIEKVNQYHIPALYAPVCSYDAMKLITSFTSKIRTEDLLKVEKAIHIVEQHIDFDRLCDL